MRDQVLAFDAAFAFDDNRPLAATFLAEQFHLAVDLGDRLHAMMDITDGLSLDLTRMCEASGCGARLDTG